MQSPPVAPHHGIEGEEKHHDDKPAVLRMVKNKVKKMKNKFGKKKQDDGPNPESETSSDEEEMEVEGDGYKGDDDPNINSAPTSDPQRVSIGDAEKFEAKKVPLGDVIGDVKEDPAVPKSTNPPARGGEEIGMTPVIQSFEAISVSNKEPKPKPELEPKPETQPSDATGSTDHPPVTYTDKFKSMATVPTEYGKNIASTVYDKLSYAGTAVVQKIRGGPTKEVNTETNRDVSQDKGVSVKDYISEKLKPGEEDQALSKEISETVQRSKEGMKATGEGATAQTMAGGTRMVEKIRGVVTSVVGGDRSDNTAVGSDLHQEKGSKEAAEPRMME